MYDKIPIMTDRVPVTATPTIQKHKARSNVPSVLEIDHNGRSAQKQSGIDRNSLCSMIILSDVNPMGFVDMSKDMQFARLELTEF
jgi:hypothetical protein